MKKSIFTLSFVLVVTLFSTTLYSQDVSEETKSNEHTKKANVWFGIRGGTDLVTPTINTEEIQSQLKSNYQFGIYARLGKKLFLQPEVYYAVKNEEVKIGLAQADQVMVNSLKVPVLVGVEFINLGLVSAHIMAGPMASVFLSQSPSDYILQHPKNEYKLQLGGGIDILRFLSLDVRYAVNLNDKFKQELNNLTFKSGINVTVGVHFR